MQGARTQYTDVGIPGGCLDTDMFRGGRQDTLLQLHLPDAKLVTKEAGSLIPKKIIGVAAKQVGHTLQPI